MGHCLRQRWSHGPWLRTVGWLPPALDGDQQAQLKAAVQALPEKAGIGLANWNWKVVRRFVQAGIPQIKPTFLGIAPSGIPSNIIPHSKGIKCGLIRSNSPFSYSNHRPAKPKIPKPLVYAQVSPLGTSFATPYP